MKKKITVFLIFTFLIIFSACSKQENKLIIFHAGSLTVPFKQVIKEFQKENPDVKIEKEIAGSRACARKIADLNKTCDVFASADYTVIDKLLIPDYADWNIKFASNEMAIVFTEKSKYKNKINGENWAQILLKDDVSFGRSDPNADPCGYRTVLTIKLAEKYFGEKGLAEKLLGKDVKYIRPKEVDLLALLETGELDYIFLYRSVAKQHGLEFLILPDSINLKDNKLSDFYKTVSVEISGKKPGEKITKKGAPMVYGITIPKNNQNKLMAEKFLKFLLSEKGMEIMQANGQPSVVPTVTSTYNRIPKSLKKFAKGN